VAIDFCLNETSRHADVLLPGTLALEHDQYDLLFNALAIRNVARYSAPVLRPSASGREDWQILLELATGIARRTSGLRAPAPWYGGGVPAAVHPSAAHRLRAPVRSLRRGAACVPEGAVTPRARASRSDRRPGATAGWPAPSTAIHQGEADHACAGTDAGRPRAGGCQVRSGGGRLRDNNSWMHNVPRLMKGRNRCTLWMNPAEASRLGLTDGQQVVIAPASGRWKHRCRSPMRSAREWSAFPTATVTAGMAPG
jgi:hypothetical protein